MSSLATIKSATTSALPAIFPSLQETNWTDPISKYHRLKTCLDSAQTPTLLAIGIMGFVGACFSLIIFLRERSSPSDYFLYKIISSCEAAQMFVLALVRLSTYFNCERNYICSFFWAHVSICIMNICADTVDFLILFLCVERTWACLLPFKFKNVNKRLLEKMAVILAFLVPIFLSTFQAFELTLQYDEKEGVYRDSPSQFAQSQFYAVIITVNTVRFYATACAITIATVSSIVGFWRTARRTQSLTKNRERKRELDLCCLQLCTAAPVVINHLLYAVSLRFGHYSIFVPQPSPTGYQNTTESSFENRASIGYSQLNEQLGNAEAFEYLKLSTNISDALAHALQFYFYLMFCLKIRQGFIDLWRRKSNNDPKSKSERLSREETPMLNKTSSHPMASSKCGIVSDGITI